MDDITHKTRASLPLAEEMPSAVAAAFEILHARVSQVERTLGAFMEHFGPIELSASDDDAGQPN